MQPRILHLAMACAALLLTACGEGGTGSGASSTPAPSPSATRTPMPAPVVAGALLPAAGKTYFGAYDNTSGLVGGNTPADVASVEAALGRPLALHMQYEQFTANFSGRALQDDFANYRIPVVSWNCGAPDAQIAAGAYDATIQLKAIEAKNFGWPVFVRFLWDPNLPASMLGRSVCYDPSTDLPNNGLSPAQFIAAWHHVRSIFNQEGATNVVWLWSVSASAKASDALQYFPGASQVDWIGMDDYDLTNSDFASTFTPLYAKLAGLNKPIMISETGAAASQQSAFFTGAVSALKTQLPEVRAFLYYDAIDYVTGQNQDWRVTPDAFQAFSSFANDPYMAGAYVP